MSPAEQLRIELRPDRQRLVVLLHGELDHVTAPVVRVSIEMALADGWDEVVVDLSALSFMDAGGLNLLFVLRDLGGGGVVSMVAGRAEAARVLGMLPGAPPLPRADPPPSPRQG